MPLRGYSEAEIALMARRRLERPLLATLWLGAVIFGLAEGNAFYALAGTFAVAVNALAVEQRREVYVHRLWVNIAVLGAVAILLLEVQARKIFLPGALAHFMILMQVCKLFERKANRDYVQMLALSVLTVVAAALFSQAMWFAVLLAVYLALAAYSAMILTIKRGLDAAAQARLACETTPLSASQVAWNVIRDWPGRAVIGKLGGVVATMIAAGVVVFVVAPRTELTGPALLPERGMMSVSGYARELHLGRSTRVYLSEKIVMQVACDGGSTALTGTLGYFRGKVMDSYSQSNWQHAPRGPEPAAMRSAGPTSALAAGALELTVTMDPELLPELFAPYPALGWEARGGDLQVDEDMTARLLRSTRRDRPYRYRVYVLPDSLAATRQAELSERFAPDASSPPSASVAAPSRVVDLARQWCRDLLEARPLDPALWGPSDLAIAQRIAERLKENYAYSLDLSSADPDRDGVEDFLFYMKQGHCEYFASALTVMCRALDVPARLVTGFRVEETDGSPGRYVVRERDAHAWTEVYVPLTGWVTVDATPAAREELVSRHWWRRVDTFLSRLAFYWYNLVVGYDANVQNQVWQQLVWAVQQGYLALAGLVSATRLSFENLLIRGYIDQAMIRLSIALAAVAAVLEALLGVRIYRRRARRGRATRVLAAQPWGALVFIPVLLDRLERQDPQGSIDRTAMETARRAQRQRALPAGELEDLVSIYYRARWGGRRPSDGEVAAARRRTEALSERLASVRGRVRGIRR